MNNPVRSATGVLPKALICQGSWGNLRPAFQARAFSSEVETGSRQENASNQKSRAPFRFHRNGALGAAFCQSPASGRSLARPRSDRPDGTYS
ncbi:hypothetical protein FFI89_019870 [Bradyrhizobium sp. KBS0727]|nr:hypothetical protein FFI71_019875 [Bradyrhizobium sp. KBS0725]QDW45806.1 hypothetical protein FFI89_019870 [Bradyrhizobium sp. KBS0727]